MRAALYARVSCERQEKEHTIGSQVEALRAYAVKHGMDIVEEFTHDGYSGARLDRPALDRMRDLAERRGFEVLLIYCTDRLARKFVLQALILDELERFGVKIIFLEGGAADDPLSKLMHQITGAVEFERAKITRTLSTWQALSRPVRRNCVARCALRLHQNSAPGWGADPCRNPGGRSRRRPADLRQLCPGGAHGSSDRETAHSESHSDAAKRRAMELVRRRSDSARRSVHRHLLLQPQALRAH
jgi:hypothetical protein